MPRWRSPAGNDINVNAAVDGRDDVLPGPSGSITMTAGNDLNLNDDIVSQDAAVSLTATAGSITPASGKGVYAGSGDISETSGQTLDTGITATTGALTLRSTGGMVNVNTAIPDTVGAVTISAGTDVNINQTITNLKSGGNLAVTAGHDINVLAPVDGRAGVASGGTVTMTAGNDLNLPTFIATNDGAVTMTATTGSVTVPVGTESFMSPMQWVVYTGSAPVSITSGADFSLDSPVSTSGSLHIASTGGNVNIAAPITDDTGAVTISADSGITVNHQVKSDNQPITLTAGPGGITVNAISDYDQTLTSPVNSGTADLTFNSVGDVAILDNRGISSQGTVTIDTRGQIVTGLIGDSTTSLDRPEKVVLNADNGIVFFNTGTVGEVDATSSGGSINLTVDKPGKLRVTTGTPGTLDCPTCDITITGGHVLGDIGPDVVLNAGGSINMSFFLSTDVTMTARSGDINLNQALVDGLFTADAGRDVVMNGLVWMGSNPTATGDPAPLTITAGRDIVTSASSPIHLSDEASLTMVANRNLTLNVLETLGPVSLTATTGDITLNNDIGPHIINLTGQPDFNPSDLGVASLTMSAPASTATITMQGARAEGDVVITTGGSLSAAKEITSVSGTVSITAGGGDTVLPVPIGDQDQIPYPDFVNPVIAPGPPQLLPIAPTGASASGPGAPAFAEIPVSAADQIIGGVVVPGAATGMFAVAGTPGGALAPENAGGFTGAPTGPNGQPAAPPGGSSDPGTTDSAAALRAASDSCDEQSQSGGDNGLAALTPGKSSDAAKQKNASCEAGGGQGQTASAPAGGGVPSVTTPTPTAPAVGSRQ